MWYLFDFLSRKYHYLLFIALEAIGVVLLVRGNNYQGSVYLSSANVVAGHCYEWTSNVTAYFHLRESNTQLSVENIALQEEVVALRQQLLLAERDTTWLRAQVPAGYTSLLAHVVQNAQDKRDNLLTIDKGRRDGVRSNMAVVAGSGVVGIVYLVGEHYSVVIPVLNSHSKISCAIRGKGYYGYLNWTGGDPQTAYMEDVPRYAHYKRGDMIETSGYSAVFPAGIDVGRVVATYNSPDGLTYRIKVLLTTNFSTLRDVCVVDNAPQQEQWDLFRLAQDSLAQHRGQ